ncbi:MAG: hypothetical protein GY782_10665, partial [Gammaproteobacteria bacterium]|nr:hypothetical protein [Gammaproteobacteria bacterium]
MNALGIQNSSFLQKIVPSQWRLQIFKRVHSYECGHMGYDRVYPQIWQRFFWHNMSEDVLQWLKVCKSCQQAKTGVGPGKLPLKTDLVSTAM